MNKFPSTPHLANLGINSIRDDKVMSDSERNEFLSNHIVVEEKIDGANLGIFFNDNGQIQLQNRGNVIESPYSGQWMKLPNWIKKHQDNLFDILSSDFILYGEWCFAQHSIVYNSLPDWFICFDMFDKKQQRFLSNDLRNDLLKDSGIQVVKEISRGYFAFSELINMIHKSYYSDEIAEGIYLRNNEDRWLKSRAKLVRPQFIQHIDQHWSKSILKENHLQRDYASNIV